MKENFKISKVGIIFRSNFSIFILFLGGALVGFALLPRLSMQYLPSEKAPRLTVSYNWVNASPEVLERKVTSILEGAFNLIIGVKRIYSVSKRHGGYINLELDKRADLTYLRFEVATKIRQLYPQLPEGLTFPQISVHNPDESFTETPLLTYSLSGQDSPANLYRYAREVLSPPMAFIKGIQNIKVNGGNYLEWQIMYDDALCKILGLKEAFLLSALQSHFQKEALGIIQQGVATVFIQLDNELGATPIQVKKQLESIPLMHKDNRIIYLKNIATVQLSEQAPRYHYRINGKNSIRLLFFPERNVNTLDLANVIKREMKHLEQYLPPSYQLYMDEDATEYLRQELQKIGYRTVFFFRNFIAICVIDL